MKPTRTVSAVVLFFLLFAGQQVQADGWYYVYGSNTGVVTTAPAGAVPGVAPGVNWRNVGRFGRRLVPVVREFLQDGGTYTRSNELITKLDTVNDRLKETNAGLATLTNKLEDTNKLLTQLLNSKPPVNGPSEKVLRAKSVYVYESDRGDPKFTKALQELHKVCDDEKRYEFHKFSGTEVGENADLKRVHAMGQGKKLPYVVITKEDRTVGIEGSMVDQAVAIQTYLKGVQ